MTTYRAFWWFQLAGWGLFLFILMSGLIGCSTQSQRNNPNWSPYCDMKPKPKWC